MPRLSRKFLLLALCILSIVGFLEFDRQKPIAPVQHLTILDRRKQYTTFARLSAKDGQSLDSNCTAYFNNFHKLKRPSLLEQAAFEHNGLLFKKTKWLREATKNYRRERRRKKERPEEGYERKILDRYFASCEVHSKYEEGFVADMAHMRAFGKCFLENKNYPARHTRLCDQASSELYPFLSGLPPRIEYIGDSPQRAHRPAAGSCYVKQLMRSGQGNGIVIPISPSDSRSRQLVRLIRLIKVLRAINNTLPIEVMLMDDEPVRRDLKQDILSAAKKNDTRLLNDFSSKMAKHPDGSPVYPEQDIRFVYLQRAVDSRFYVTSDTSMMALAPLLSSFEKAAVLTTHTIPLTKSIEELLQDPDLHKFGTKFYRGRSLQENKVTRFPHGYFETNDLVNGLANVGVEEQQWFGLNRSREVYSKRVKHEGYTQLIDPSFFVIDKSVAVPGLLLSVALQYYKVIGSKYDFSVNNHESLWLGQELTGTFEYVNFNAHFAVGAGLLTPPENVKAEGPSQELCSSSWAQLSDKDDQSLLYITTHQIENKVLPGFDIALKEKFTVTKNSKASSDPIVDESIYTDKLKKNPLRVESILRPIAVNERQHNKQGLADLPWIQKERFGASDDYWCAYDVVGSVESPSRGVVTNLSDEKQQWYNTLIEIWLSSSHQQSSSRVSYDA